MIVDRNRLQQGATTRETNDLDPLDQKAAAFGFAVVEVDGHDHGALLDVLSAVPHRPGQADVRHRPHAQGPPDLVHEQQRRLAPQGPERGAAAPRRCEELTRQPKQDARARPRARNRAPPHRDHPDRAAPPRTRRSIVDQPRFDCRNAYVETLADLAEHDHRIVGVVNDSVGSSKLDAFKKAFPDRLINVGIAEQDMVGVAAGLANGGRIPFVSAASCFLTARALEQIKADVAYSDRNVKLCGMSPGVAYGELGPTHQSIEDVAWLRAVDNMTIVVPADPVETAAALRWAAATDGPAFIRVSRMSVPQIYPDDHEFVPGRAVTVREGDDVTLISNGTILWRALAAAEHLAAEGVSARVLSMPTVKPLDAGAVVAAARRRPGSSPPRRHPGRWARRGGRRDRRRRTTRPGSSSSAPGFAPTGSAGFLLDRFGMSPEGIADAARRCCPDPDGLPRSQNDARYARQPPKSVMSRCRPRSPGRRTIPRTARPSSSSTTPSSSLDGSPGRKRSSSVRRSTS